MPPSPHPRYLVVRLRRPGVWGAARLAVLLALAGQVALLVARPQTGLTVFWGLAIPLLPFVFLLAPSVWRNVCPMATANQLPRRLGLTRERRLPPWLDRHGYGIGLLMFFCLAGLRPVVLESSAGSVVVLLALALLAPFAGGLIFSGKSGFCGSVCPLRPSQDVLSRMPAVQVRHAHCAPCVGCSSSCQDVKPRTQLLEQLHAADPARRAYRRIFAGALPAFTVALYTAPSVATLGAGTHAARLLVAALAGIGLLYVLEALTGATPGQVVAFFGAAAIAVFGWFNVPVLVTTADALAGFEVPAWAMWEARLVLGFVAVRWLVRTWRDSARRERTTTAPVAAPVVRDRRAPVAPPAPARPTTAAPVVAGDPPVAIPDRRGPDRGMRPPTVTLWPRGDQVEVEVGTTVAEAARAAGVALPEGCGTGICGCDPVRVRSGADNLLPASADETATLERLALPAGTRLACSTRVMGDVAVDLEPGEEEARPAASARRIAVVAGDRAAVAERIVVVGNGVAGITAASHARRLAPGARIDVVSDSQRPFYNRIAVTRLIHEQILPQLQLMPDRWYEKQRIQQWLGTAVTRLDLAGRQAVLATGQALPYDRLILATGARSLMPPIPGHDLPGVFGLRAADDATAIRAWVQEHRSRRAVVVGGGVLGVEAADALTKLGLDCTIVERSAWLSQTEVDARAGTLLREEFERRDVEVLLGTPVVRIAGTGRPEAVEVAGGRRLPADVVVVCAGIAPNAELARQAGLRTDRGVLVDERMRTSDPHVLACGDVAQHRAGHTGRWPIAVEQAEVAAVSALGGHRPYGPGPVPTKLKVSGLVLNVMGAKEAGPGEQEVVHEDRAAGHYRKLVVADGRLTGAIVFGDATHWDALVAAVREQREVAGVLRELRAGDLTPLQRAA